MAKQIARLLKADIQETSDLKSIAKMLSKKGRGGDTMLAHITPKEARILKEAGGAGTINPDTGLMEFYDGDWSIPSSYSYGADYAASQYQPETYTASMPEQSPIFDVTQYQTPGGYQAPAQAETPAFNAPAYTGGMFDYTLPETAAAAQAIDYSQLPYAPFAGAPAAAPVAAQAPVPQFGVPAVTAPAPSPVAEGAVTPTQPGLAQKAGDILNAVKAGGGDVVEYLKKNPELLKLAMAGTGAVAGRVQAQQAAKQIQQATQEQKQLGQPYQKAGQEMQRAALAGELTPQSAQAYQALQAQMRQGVEARGGVGVAQAQAQMEAFRQTLLQNQYNYGLQVAQIGDQYAAGAIRTGLQMDQNLQQATDRKSTRLNSSHVSESRMPSSA